MNEMSRHTLGTIRLGAGVVTVATDNKPVVGQTNKLHISVKHRQQVTLSELAFELFDEYWTTTGIEHRSLISKNLGSISIQEGVSTRISPEITIPETTAIGCGPAACTAVLTFSIRGETVSRSFGLTPLSEPKLTAVIEPVVEQGYTVCDSFLVTDRSGCNHSITQSVRFAPTDDTPTTEPVDVFVRSVSDGLHVAPTVGHEPRTPVSELPDPVLVTEDDGDDRLVDAVEQL
jgi:hypothetical protein